MSGVNIVIAVLVILGVVMVVLGLFGGPQTLVLVLGVVAIIAAGVLAVASGRR